MRVVVGLSGGVDSSVAAYLLHAQGHEVIGIYMRNWSDTSLTKNNECPWIEDSQDALLVAQKIGIPFQVVDLSKDYYEKVVEYMFAEYRAGRTPNPDVLCNRAIKFDSFLKIARNLGADYVATGHYARSSAEKDQVRLWSGKDAHKDQSYFLCQLTQDQLKQALFPIGHLEKKEVRAIAAAQGLITAQKKDSQGLCFVGHVKLPHFLAQKLQPKAGALVLIPNDLPFYQKPTTDTFSPSMAEDYVYTPEMGRVIGQQDGAHYYTVGQRKGLGIGGFVKPLFVLQIDTDQNLVYVGEGEEHPGLYRRALKIDKDLHWIHEKAQQAWQNASEEMVFDVRIRYRQALQKARLLYRGNAYYLFFEKAQKAIAKGQFAALYQAQELIASGVID